MVDLPPPLSANPNQYMRPPKKEGEGMLGESEVGAEFLKAPKKSSLSEIP